MIVPLSEGHEKNRSLIGGKAKNLSTLMKLGISVPNGFIVSSSAFLNFIKANRLGSQINHYMKTMSNPYIKINELFQSHTIPSDLEKEIKEAYDNLTFSHDIINVSVRSSASAEDLQDQSFAGQYETCLNIGSFDRLLKSIKKCWASVWSDQALQYLHTVNIDIKEVKISVLVQAMVQADTSGVAFSINPVTLSYDEIIINASYGLGEPIVSGLITPDLFIISKHDHKILHKELGLKEFKLVGQADGTKETPTSEQEIKSFSLNFDQINRITNITKKIEHYYQYPVDIEFTVKENEINVLQVRPITTVKGVVQS
ncbi:PEP/pyruvate-binding domain-containing protein [Bacillus aquiflavi]|uniref:Phosphoenolpyruvate synthase n=1 Tax=Bacillus aquiflavi TaxID=2672567 RepID=A0A6B3W0J9_9BACI|nr:PEP/pyruvate-binding domain-containing protein [Bacillus aquiflavi]MBA4537127.1 PEP/pyruvate-binding domain-containing protein [Bacillus aquiflavi]NEY82712.1 pyruvate-binding protein [Bacillus aquiflavi]UAC49754.1 PEP/pyruvate-binding domain-containing protein [Bacillus aquiflavi]